MAHRCASDGDRSWRDPEIHGSCAPGAGTAIVVRARTIGHEGRRCRLTATDPYSETVEHRIGPELKRLRERAGLSVRALADKAGFSASFISQLEHGVVSPSIASLETIASMLGVTLGDLFTASEATDVAVIRADVRPSFSSSWSKARIEAVMPFSAGRSLEAMMVTLDPGGTSGKRPSPGALDQLAVIFDGQLH